VWKGNFVAALPKAADAAHSEELKQASTSTSRTREAHVQRLERVTSLKPPLTLALGTAGAHAPSC
jgi:ferritin-like metal-binding protein YciE